ncbi:hypothetical protein D3C86_1645890 [compost metagenome]
MVTAFKSLTRKSSICIAFLFMFLFPISFQAQEKTKDTLFFKIDNSYIFENKNIPKMFFIQDSNTSEEFCFAETTVFKNLRPMKVLDLKYFIRNSRFYINEGSLKLANQELMDFLKHYKIFLVRENEGITECIAVDITLRAY